MLSSSASYVLPQRILTVTYLHPSSSSALPSSSTITLRAAPKNVVSPALDEAPVPYADSTSSAGQRVTLDSQISSGPASVPLTLSGSDYSSSPSADDSPAASTSISTVKSKRLRAAIMENAQHMQPLQPDVSPPVSTVSSPPWLQGALAAVSGSLTAESASTVGGDTANTSLAADIKGVPSTSDDAALPFVTAILSSKEQNSGNRRKYQGSEQGQTRQQSTAQGSSDSEQWPEEFISGVLAAVSAVVHPTMQAVQQLSVAVEQQQQQQQQQLGVQRDDSVTQGNSNPGLMQRQQQEENALPGDGFQAAAGTHQEQAGEDGQQQQQRLSLMTDARMQLLLTALLRDAETTKEDAGHAAALSSAGWGYRDNMSGSSSTRSPYLQRAQWMVEEIHRLQHTAASQLKNTSPAGSVAQQAVVQQGSIGRVMQQHSEQDPQQQQQQQQTMMVIRDLQLQVHKLLLAHITHDAVSWRCILHVVQDYGSFLNPKLAAASLQALQAMYLNPATRPHGVERDAAARLTMHLLRLTCDWQHLLGPWEVVSVLWSLVRLRSIRHLKLRQDSQLRDALVEQYQHLLRQTALQLQQLKSHRRHADMQQQQQDGLELEQQVLQQQRQAVLQQLPVFTHAAVLLAGARMGLSASKQLQEGTSKLICKLSHAHICHMKQQLRTHRGDPLIKQQAAVLASHMALLLYAMSELRLRPEAVLLGSTWRFTRVLLQDMAPADVAMLAVAFGRFGAVPSKWWCKSFMRVTADAAQAMTAAATDTGGRNEVYAGAASAGAADDGGAGAAATMGVQLNPADITCVLTAAHSMNLGPPSWWVAAMFDAALVQLRSFSLFQCTVLLLSLSKLQVQPQLAWLISVTEHVTELLGSGGARVADVSRFGSSKASSSGHSDDALVQPAKLAASQQQQHHQLSQWQQTQQTLQQDRQRRLRHIHYPDASRLCLYLLSLSKAVALLCPEDRVKVCGQLQPFVAVCACRVAADLDKLQPLDLVQLLLSLHGMQCRPGPAFMAAFAARCEATQIRFTPSLFLQLKAAYKGLGVAPPRSLLALMVAA